MKRLHIEVTVRDTNASLQDDLYGEINHIKQEINKVINNYDYDHNGNWHKLRDMNGNVVGTMLLRLHDIEE